MTVEPGRLLAGRYRVEDLLSDRTGVRSWRAVDEVLRRSVAVDILAADAPRATALVDAARRSAVVADSRFLRVLDASKENGDVYIVREWARGESLDLVLRDGPLTHRRAAWVVREIAEAIGMAHRAGIFHWRLVPENVIVTETGAVRIVGLATAAAMQGLTYAEPEAEDVRGLGRLLYATLVTKWPGGPDCALPPAPTEHGRLMLPRQVRAGVPRPLDDVCDRILGDPPRHHAPPLRTVDEVAAALADAAGLSSEVADPEATEIGGLTAARIPAHGFQQFTGGTSGGAPSGPPPALLPVPAGPPPANRAGPPPRVTAQIPVTPAGPPAGARHAAAPNGDQRRSNTWLIIALVVLVAAVIAFLIGFNLTGGDNNEPKAEPQQQQNQAPQPIKIASVAAWDPFGEGGENDDEAPLAIDGDRATFWTTMSYYNRADFGGLKPGLGLVVDLGEPRDVSSVRVDVGSGGTDFEVRVAPGATDEAPGNPDDFQTQGTAEGATGNTDVELDRAVTTRYVLVWLTKLPPSGGDFKGQVREVSVRG
ncbi:MAG: protein kinase family protein [Nocardioidaceae bacterium]